MACRIVTVFAQLLTFIVLFRKACYRYPASLLADNLMCDISYVHSHIDDLIGEMGNWGDEMSSTSSKAQ